MAAFIWTLTMALAAFRLAELIVFDDGPFDIFLNLRGLHSNSELRNPIIRTFADILVCVHCMGFWISIFLGIAYYFLYHPSIYYGFVLTLAVAGLQSLLATNLGRNRNI